MVAQRTCKRTVNSLKRRGGRSSLPRADAHPQRLLRASAGTKDPDAPDTMYVEVLAAPGTINTIPDKTLLAFAGHARCVTACRRMAATVNK